MTDYPKIVLKKGREKSLLHRHPWIFSGAVKAVPKNIVPGATVHVMSADGELLGTGSYSPESMIAVRMWNFTGTEADEAFFTNVIRQAYNLRKRVFKNLPDAYRLIHSEADGLPGYTVDIYGNHAVCQCSDAGTDLNRELFARIVRDVTGVKGVYERSDLDIRTREGLQPRTGILLGDEPPALIPFTENGVKYQCDPRNGHKTGFYLDQRLSRKAVLEAAAGMENVLNCFCYTGGFGLAAAAGGSRHTLNVDSSGPALELARSNAALNGFSADQFETLEADVFQCLRTFRDSRKSFDMIILDPPKFADSAARADKALRAYKDINLLALKLLNPGGMLFTFSCSGAITEEMFAKMLSFAVSDAGIDFRITTRLGQGPDHPVSAACPESRYLKGLAGVRIG